MKLFNYIAYKKFVFFLLLFLFGCSGNSEQLIKLKFNNEYYPQSVVKKFLNEVYVDGSSEELKNNPIWMPNDEVLNYSFLVSPDLFSDEIEATRALTTFNEIFNQYLTLTNLNSQRVHEDHADVIFVLTDNFKKMKNLDFVKVINPRSNEFWENADDKTQDGYSRIHFNYMFKKNIITGKTRIDRSYVTIQLDQLNTTDFKKNVARAICVSLINFQKSESILIDNSCINKSPDVNQGVYFFPLDAALIEVLYENPKISQTEKRKAVNDLISVITEKYRIN